MEKEEIELWYEEKKQRLTEQYLDAIERGVGVAARKERFDRAMMRINREYERKHQKFERDIIRKSRNQRLRMKMFLPLQETGSALSYSGGQIGSGFSRFFRNQSKKAAFAAQIIWIKNAYKVPDKIGSVFSPAVRFYRWHLTVPVYWFLFPWRVLGDGFVGIGNFFTQGGKDLGLGIWNRTKKGAKTTSKNVSGIVKNVNSKFEMMDKKYHEWYAARVQKDLDRKAAKKAAKEEKIKAKEEEQKAKEKEKEEEKKDKEKKNLEKKATKMLKK